MSAGRFEPPLDNPEEATSLDTLEEATSLDSLGEATSAYPCFFERRLHPLSAAFAPYLVGPLASLVHR